MTSVREVPRDFEDYAQRFPKGVQERLRIMRQAIRSAAPDANETISYGIPAFRLDGLLCSFAAYRRHIGFYPGASTIDAFHKELSAYKSARGSVQFPLDQALPLSLVTRIVEFSVLLKRQL